MAVDSRPQEVALEGTAAEGIHQEAGLQRDTQAGGLAGTLAGVVGDREPWVDVLEEEVGSAPGDNLALQHTQARPWGSVHGAAWVEGVEQCMEPGGRVQGAPVGGRVLPVAAECRVRPLAAGCRGAGHGA